ncbi:MAG: flagellar biosynthetic protein FliO [Planctomycetes bacterium]|nr:flagellar biosynthetic protein FliO [Planctomycetota bacterium]
MMLAMLHGALRRLSVSRREIVQRFRRLRWRLAGVLCFLLSPLLGAAPDDARSLAPEDSVERLLGSSAAEEEARRDDQPASPLVVLLRLSASVAAILALGGGALILQRRWTLVKRRNAGAGGVQVLGRTSLSPRHSIYLVRIGQRVLAVGVSGDRMTALLELAGAELPARGEGGPHNLSEELAPGLDSGGLREASAGEDSSGRLRSDRAPERGGWRAMLRGLRENLAAVAARGG